MLTLEILLAVLVVTSMGASACFGYATTHGASVTMALLQACAFAVGFLLLLCVTGSVMVWREKARQRAGVARLAYARSKIEGDHPDCRATPLSSGDWLLTLRSTGKTKSVVKAPAADILS